MITSNLILAWAWILLGFITGMLIGMFFHKPDWLGGYGSHPRRMYRLGHISFFGLGAVDLFFALTVKIFEIDGSWIPWASRAFIVGAITMPICCALMAHFKWAHHLFAVPVVSLLIGGTIMLKELMP
jgi:hypothetical protein